MKHRLLSALALTASCLSPPPLGADVPPPLPDSALTAVGYGGDYLADFDDSSAGSSHGIGQPVRIDLGPVSPLVDPPDTMHIPDYASDFIASLPPGDTTEHEYMAEVRTIHGHAPFAHDLHLAIAAGTLNSDADYHSLRTTWLSDRVAAVAPDIAAAGALITSAGGTVIEQGVLFPFVAFLADEPTIQSLLASAPFESLSIDAPIAEPHIEDGVSLRAITKMGLYVSTGTDLNGDGIPELYRGALSRVAVVEVNDSPGIDSLPALHAMAPAAGSSLPRNSRLIERVSCTVGATSTSCGDGEDAPGRTGSVMWTHGTGVTSVLLGDLEAGQDPAIFSQDWPLASFQSPEARFDYYWFGQPYSFGQPDTGREDRAHKRLLEHLAMRPSLYRYSNHSYGDNRFIGSNDCSGKANLSRDVAHLFESGILPVASAGNRGALATGWCTISAPGDSFAALTAAAADWSGNRADYSSIPSPALDGRVLLDVAAPGHYSWTTFLDLPLPEPQAGYVSNGQMTVAQALLMPPHPDTGEVCNLRDDNGDGVVDTGWEDWPYVDHPYCNLIDNAGTSYAAPAITGALTNYREFYLNKYSRLIELPGIAMVNALVRGDGRGATGIGFSTDLGAGNLRMAMTHSPYLTAPWGWGTGRVCVRDSQDVLIPIANTMPAGVERLRAVAFWHDRHNRRRHIDLAVLQDGTLKGQDISDDVKKRVHLRYATELTAGASYQLRLRGRDIRGNDDQQCGSRQKAVYWAYIYAKAGL